MFDARTLFLDLDGQTLDARGLEVALRAARARHALQVPGAVTTRDVVQVALRKGWLVRNGEGNYHVDLQTTK